MTSTVFIALINPKSGGNVGPKLLQSFKEILPENRVYDLSDPEYPGPSKALEDHKDVEHLRIIACGGDGTVGWILSVMDKMTFPNGQPAIGIIPLGTGNDLSRSLNWGGKFKEKPLQKVLLDVDKSSVIHMDRWVLHTKAKSEESQESPIEYSSDKLPLNVFNNYFSLGIDAHIALKFHTARNENPEQFSSRTTNLIFYGKDSKICSRTNGVT